MVRPLIPKEELIMSKETTKKKVTTKTTVKKDNNTEVKETVKEEAKVKAPKANKAKVNTVYQFKNSELAKFFKDNGCQTYTTAKDESNVVYNTFGTKSRVLQQSRGYQLLLTNGHKKVKEDIVECENDDVVRFEEFYKGLDEDTKKKVVGMDGLRTTKLSDSEMPRERTVKIADKDLLQKFIQFMASFEENKVLVASK